MSNEHLIDPTVDQNELEYTEAIRYLDAMELWEAEEAARGKPPGQRAKPNIRSIWIDWRQRRKPQKNDAKPFRCCSRT